MSAGKAVRMEQSKHFSLSTDDSGREIIRRGRKIDVDELKKCHGDTETTEETPLHLLQIHGTKFPPCLCGKNIKENMTGKI